MDRPVQYDDTLRRAQLEQYSRSVGPKDFESGLDTANGNDDIVVRRTLGRTRPKSGTQVRKRLASFKKVSKDFGTS